MKRRELITLLGGAAVTWPLAARAQGGVRHIGVLMGAGATAGSTAYVAAFTRRLEELGWIEGRKAHIDVRWWNGDQNQLARVAKELLGSQPDIVVPFTNLALTALKPMLADTPMVFVGVGDPVGSGFVASLARPGGNITGFISNEPAMGGKWLEILKETVPGIKRVLALYHPETPLHQEWWQKINAAAPRIGVEAVAGGVHDADEIERVISAFAATPDGGIISLPHAITNIHHALIISLERRFRLPSIHGAAENGRDGALIAYGPDYAESFRQAAGYVDRVLRGEKPSDLPVQAPTKYELVINLKTAMALGLTVPPTLLTRADEVIE
jgi:putative tryptophan/tyrosine transport system substrate-binding protein